MYYSNQPLLCCQGVIGAGAAGLVAARELIREGHQATVFEQGCRPGGVWVYTDAVEEAHMPGETLCPLFSSCSTFLHLSRGQSQMNI